MTLPALDALIERYPRAEFFVVVGPRAREVFAGSKFIRRVVVYDKQVGLTEKIGLVWGLYRERCDLVTDLRGTLLSFVLGAKRGNRLFARYSRVMHMRDRHLLKIREPETGNREPNYKRHFFQERWGDFDGYGDYVVIAPGARSGGKRWTAAGFAWVADRLAEQDLNVVLVGDGDDRSIAKEVKSKMSRPPAADLTGETTLAGLSALLKQAKLVICCDSAVLHLAGYLDRPVVAIFGPTDEDKYGPWSERSVALRARLSCAPCGKAQCKTKDLACMRAIKREDVLAAAVRAVANHYPTLPCGE